MKRVAISLMAVVATIAANGASRPMPEYLKSAVVYQIVLHNFTQTGTFKAARAMLPHVRSTGADVVYLTPFFEMDRDMDQKCWSPRQKKSGFNSPLNPYHAWIKRGADGFRRAPAWRQGRVRGGEPDGQARGVQGDAGRDARRSGERA